MTETTLVDNVNVEKILTTALARGGEFADVFAEEKATTMIEVEDGRVEQVVQGRRSGAGVRVIHSLRTSYSYTDEVATGSLVDCAGTASLAVKNGGAPVVVPAGAGWDRHRLPAAKHPADYGVKDKLDLIWRAERAARSVDSRIVQVRVVFANQTRRIAVADSLGLRGADEASYLIFHVVAVAADESGIQVAHEAMGGTLGLEAFDESGPDEVALTAARRAVRNLEARPAPGGTMSVVLAAEAGGTMIHEAVGHGLEADLAEQGLSVYQDRIGERIASPLITVLDDATLPGKRGTFSIDDEGMPAQKTVLVDRGVLKGYMYDRRLAMKKGCESTGNGRRESYAHAPIVRMTNTLIAAGETAPDEVLHSVDRGLLVRRMGGGEVNTVNGDFVFDVEDGWLIENGEPSEPVRGATLTGNGPKVLMDVDLVGSDLGFGIGTCGKDGQGAPVADAQPTLRIPEIVVGGRMEE